jgi:hypothetical protein
MYKCSYLFILLVILLCLGSQIEIFGESPSNLKSELKASGAYPFVKGIMYSLSREYPRYNTPFYTYFTSNRFFDKFEPMVAMHCKEIWIYAFPEKELRGLSPNFHIHLSVSGLYIPTMGPPFFLQQNRQTDFGNI